MGSPNPHIVHALSAPPPTKKPVWERICKQCNGEGVVTCNVVGCGNQNPQSFHLLQVTPLRSHSHRCTACEDGYVS